MKKLIAKPWLDKMLDVSTIHISQNDAELLQKDAMDACHSDSLIVKEYPEGFFVYVSREHGDDQVRTDFSPEFKAIMAEARRLKCKWVCFDGDGVMYDGLKEFNW